MTENASPRRFFHPFRILSDEERRRHLDDYLAFLNERDGERDIERFQLSKREAFFRDLDQKPVHWGGDFDQAGFYQHLREEAEPEVDARVVLIVSAAKANLGEAYGVEVELSSFASRPHRATESPLYLHLMFEERYHTRILDEICRVCGVESERLLPSPLLRVLIHAMMYLPDRFRWIPIFAGEVLGSEVFNILRKGTSHFSEDPEVEERLRTLFTEIWIDEVFHAAYLRARLGRFGIWIARLMVPLVARSVFKQIPQGAKIGLTREAVLERIRHGIEMPPGTRWMPPDVTSS